MCIVRLCHHFLDLKFAMRGFRGSSIQSITRELGFRCYNSILLVLIKSRIRVTTRGHHLLAYPVFYSSISVKLYVHDAAALSMSYACMKVFRTCILQNFAVLFNYIRYQGCISFKKVNWVLPVLLVNKNLAGSMDKVVCLLLLPIS